MELTQKQKQTLVKLENIVGYRFNEMTLKQKLSEIFGEQVSMLEVDEDGLVCDYEYTVGVSNEESEMYGYGSIYYLKMRESNDEDNTLYVTEVGYNFEMICGS
jgi:hypothetical protein